MKKFFTLLVSIPLVAGIYAQSPGKISYQAVIRNSKNKLVVNQKVGMQISILQSTPSGTEVYTETQTPTTNANGLVSIEIGGQAGFNMIDWSGGPYFIKTQTDVEGGTNYTIAGTSQLMSVPYALYAKTAENTFSGNYNDLSNKPDVPTSAWAQNGNNIFYSDGSVGVGISNLSYPYPKLEVKGVIKGLVHDGTNNAGGNFQAWTDGTDQGLKAVYSFYPTFQIADDNSPRRSADIVSGFNGGAWGREYLAFHVGSNSMANDNDSITDEKMRITNEGNIGIGIEEPIEKLEVDGTIYSHSGGFKFPDGTIQATAASVDVDIDSTNELQILSLSNDTIFLSNGGYVQIPSGNFNNLTGRPDIKTNPNIFIGLGTGENTPDSKANLAIGDSALFNNGVGATLSSHSTGNTAIGSKALYSNITGSYNTANGYRAMYLNTTGSYNTANGTSALYSNITGYNNTANGYNALHFNASGYSNTANGTVTLYSNTTGSYNTANGCYALYSNTTGSYNTANGTLALYSNTTGSYNTANGFRALHSNTEGSENTAYGYRALDKNISGFSNTANGNAALYFNTIGSSNVAIGTRALFRNTTQSNLVAIGDSALFNNGLGATLSHHSTGNTAIGSKALFSNTIGWDNTANGYRALYSNTTGNNNTTMGYRTLYYNRDGNNNCAFGYEALLNNTTGYQNTALSDYALFLNTTGNRNIAIGTNALFQNKSGSTNIAIGVVALAKNTNRNNLIAIGDSALFNNGSGATASHHATGNTAVGSKALYSNTTGYYNTANGYHALYSNTTGRDNTANGLNALYSNTTGDGNTANGNRALYSNTTGGGNTANGYEALYSNTTGNGNTAFGNWSGNNITSGTNNTAIGYNARVPLATASNQVRIGNTHITYAGIQVAWTVTSDLRWKESVRELPYGLAFVNQLKPVDYIRKNNEHKTREAGFIAQDVEAVLNELGMENSGLISKGAEGGLELRYNDFIPILTKALQEQQALIEDLQSKVSEMDELKAELEEIKSLLK